MALIHNAGATGSTWRCNRPSTASGLQRCLGALRRALIVPVLSAAIAAATAAANATPTADPQAASAGSTGYAGGLSATGPSAAERVMASELAGRGDVHDALSMMVTSVVRMVQAGRRPESRWQDS